MTKRIGLVLALVFGLLAGSARADLPFGAGTGKTTEWVVTNAAGGSSFTIGLGGRRAVEFQNLGPNAIYCTVGGETPLATGALGRKIDAGATWSLSASSAVTLRCIAATAAQVTGAATQVTELR